MIDNIDFNDYIIDYYRGFDILISHKYKFIYCLIQKNGSASVFSTILYNEYNIEGDGSIIWNYILEKIAEGNEQCKAAREAIFHSFLTPQELMDFCKDYKDYTKFIVINDSYKRLLSWINFFPNLFSLIEFTTDREYLVKSFNFLKDIYQRYNKLIINNSYKENKAIKLKNPSLRCEYHCLPQKIFIEFFKEAFAEDELRIVPLKELKDFVKKSFGLDLILNNETKNKIVSEELFSSLLNLWRVSNVSRKKSYIPFDNYLSEIFYNDYLYIEKLIK